MGNGKHLIENVEISIMVIHVRDCAIAFSLAIGKVMR
jgi:hypothetical protein